jgi:hypothetical protein
VIDQAALNRRVAGKGGTQYYPWLNIHGKDRGQPTPTQAKSGRLRLVRTGAELAFWAAAGDDDELKLLFTEPFGAEDIRGINVVGSTGSAAAALDVRFSELRIRAEAAPVKTAPPPASASKEANPPAREYAQKYAQSFQGQAKPERWDYTGPFADRCVHFERTGLRIALPTGWKNERGSTGLNLPATVQGNFEITATFELLDAPEPADAGHPATRISLGIYKNTQRANVATVSRIISSSSGDVFVAWQSLSSDVAGKSERFGNGTTDAKVGRLRLVRDGGDLYYCIAEGPGGEFHTLRKFAFGSEDLKDIRLIGSTGGEKALVDVRFTDLLIRADGLPDLAAPRDDAVPGGEVAQPAPPSRAWMAATAIIGGAVFVFLLAGSLVGVVLYRRRNPTPVPTIDHGKKSDAGPTTLAIACAACGKQLKCKIDAVGKKLKCPQCGKATLVAAPTAAG